MILGCLLTIERGEFSKLPELIDDHLVAYLIRNTSMDVDACDQQKLSRLRRLANGVSKIIEAENKG